MSLIIQKQQAWALFNEGSWDEARLLCLEIQAVDSGDAETHYLLGSCYGMLGAYEKAVAEFQECLAIQPAKLETLYSLGGAYYRLGRYEEAADQFRSMLVDEPSSYDAHCGLADSLCALGMTLDAKEHYDAARNIRPDSGAPYAGLGMTLVQRSSSFAQATALFERAVECEPNNPVFRCHLGFALSETRPNEDMGAYYRRAHDAYNEALRIAPEFPEAIAGIARLHHLEGKHDLAMEKVDYLRRRGVDNSSAAIVFATVCKHFGSCQEAAEYANQVLDTQTLPKRSFSALSMHLARLLDQMGQYEAAWPHFVAGNDAVAEPYDTVNFRLRVEKTMEVFSPAGMFALPRSDCDTKRPVFIVGMPRSGTSLVEQILSGHPQVCGGGELTFLSDILMSLPASIGSGKGWPFCASELTKDDLNRMAHRYLERLDAVADGADYVTDKMPHNFLELGLIQLLFPGARVIHCKREPKDTCLSIYFMNFLLGHEYSRDLFHIGTHYHQYLRLMDHWKRFLAIPVLDVQYEDLVTNPEPVVRSMLEHCDLEWNESCMDFHKSKRLVNTASYDQVRQPLYSRSIGRWRNYEQYLDDLEEGLERGF